MSKITDDYFEYYTKYTKEYGKNTCILMQIGSFYEMEMVKNETESIGNLIDVCELLNIQVTKKNKSISLVDRSNPYFAGFPKHSINKFLPILLENGYTVVLIDQDETEKTRGKKTRSVAGIYSPGIQPLDLEDKTYEGNNLTSILIESYIGEKCSYSIANINMSTNLFETYEGHSDNIESLLDEIYRILIRYNTKEILFNILTFGTETEYEYEYVCNYLDIIDKKIHIHWNCQPGKDYKEITKIDYQNAFFKKIYTSINFGLLDPIEYFGLEKMPITVLNCVLVLQFIARHDIKYTENFAIPVVINEYDHLVLEMNCLDQLNIVNNNEKDKISLFHILNKTKTSIGKRGLKRLLCKPFKDPLIINERFELAETLEKEINIDIVRDVLSEICDIDRLHRKMSIGCLHPYEFYNLHITYQVICDLNAILSSQSTQNSLLNQHCINSDIFKQFQEFILEYQKIFNMEELKKYNLNENVASSGNFFNKGNIKEIDDTESIIQEIESDVENIRKNLDELIPRNQNKGDWIKTSYTDQDGYFFTCTKIRCQALQKNCKEFNLSIKQTTNMCKISTDELRKLSNKLISNRDIFSKKIKIHYLEYLQNISKNSCMFKELSRFIEIFDITQSNILCKNTYNYCRPIVLDSKDSSIDCKDLRHPIIERVNNVTYYVPNDVVLDNENKGMILYALNSCGKSSLLRSIGLSIIMAQSGLYVPCKEMTIAPFDTIVTQVDLHDNLWKGNSSFVTEMIGLRKIIKMANPKTLVLSDELTKGTEVLSATAIFASSVIELLERGCKFVFTTHLQDVSKLQVIKKAKHLQVCHLSVIINDDQIIFERKLQPGPCSELYGLEIAKAVGIDSNVINRSFEIRNDILNTKRISATPKRSRYNTLKLLDKCEICGYNPSKSTDLPLDTHHIKFQCTADSNNFTGHYHKNSVCNLVCLCKSCHISVHNGNIIINGYIQSTNGVLLDYVR